MATIPSSSTPLHLPTFIRRPQHPKHSSFSVKSSDTDTPPPEDTSSSSAPTPADDGAFENRLSQVRLRYRSGTGKKAELRKAKKAGSASSSSSSSSSSLYLPPVPLKEPKSLDGSKVEIGFSLYSEKINGRIAMLGLTALLLVELATGKGVINYHTPAIILIQVYFVAAVGAIWIKYEKESVAVWPKSE